MNTKILSNNVNIPTLGFGTDLIPDGETVINAVTWAVEAGYRLIDNADCYNNQKGVGIAIHNCIERGVVKREDLFITSKVPDWKQGYEETIACCKNSLREMNLGYFDLYLVHSPLRNCENWQEKITETYKALIDLQKEGLIKNIGVSNFAQRHLSFLFKNFSEVRPVVNQIELHPEHQQRGIVNLCQKSYVQLESWGALNQGRIFKNKVFLDMAGKYHRTPSQIAIRWNLQKGYIPLVRSIKKEHIIDNFDVFNFELQEEDMKILDNLDGGDWSNMHDDSLIHFVKPKEKEISSYCKIYKLFGFIPFLKLIQKGNRLSYWYLFGIKIVKIDKKEVSEKIAKCKELNK